MDMKTFFPNFKQFLSESRKIDNKNIEYSEEQAKGSVTKVIAELKQQSGTGFNRVADRYTEIDIALKQLSEERDSLNENVKEYMDEFFDLEDKTLTRVMRTSRIAFTLSKESTSVKETTDHESILNELSKSMPELIDKINELTKKYTSIKETTTKSRLSYKIDEGVFDNIFKFLTDSFKKIKSSFMSFFNKYDKQLDIIEKRMESLS